VLLCIIIVHIICTPIYNEQLTITYTTTKLRVMIYLIFVQYKMHRTQELWEYDLTTNFFWVK